MTGFRNFTRPLSFGRELLAAGFAAVLMFSHMGMAQPEAGGAKNAGASSTAGGHTWFVRPDGGDRFQCTGLSDTAYRGRGSNQPCAFKHPYYLFTNDRYGNKAWIVQGGDTVILRGGPYRFGFRGPNPKDHWGSCPGDPFGCTMPPIPSGTPEHPTRYLGENYASCQKKTELFGGYAVGTIVNLRGSKNVDVECLELTDHAQCTRFGGSKADGEGCKTSFPLSDFGANGIVTGPGTSDIQLKNLDIHGFTSRGIIGPVAGTFTVDHVRIAFNGGAGWDFDNGYGTKSEPGAMVNASYLTVEWNGCNEEYPITHAIPAHSCFDQDAGGYGDGIGTPNTELSFTCDHCLFRYNTQDGFDLLHVSGSKISIRNSESYGNMGQQWKMGHMQSVIFQNNITVHNCRRMSASFTGAPEGYNKYLTLFCRAAGDGITFSVNDAGTYVFQNNSFAGYGATSYDILCSGTCSKQTITYQNNLNIGFPDPVGGSRPGVFYYSAGSHAPFAARDHNLYFGMRSCPSGAGELCVNPKIANLPQWNGESSLDSIDFHLKSDSPARGKGVAVQGLQKDRDGNPRSGSGQTDIGAY